MRITFKLLLTGILIFLSWSLSAQKVTISGYIKDASTGENLIGATVFNSNYKTGTITNNYGFYTLTVQEADTLGIVYSFIGYKPQTKKIATIKDLTIDIQLASSDNSLDEVVINAKRNDNNVKKAQMGVIDVPLKQINTLPAIGGENDILKVSGGIGLLSSNLTLEGPIKKEKGSFIISGRRSYIDLLAKPFIPKNKNNTNYYLYDLNAKFNYTLTDKDRLYLSFFTGLDDAKYTGVNSLNYGLNIGNRTGTFRWNHLFSNKIFSNTSVIYNEYHNSLTTSQGQYVEQQYSGIRDLNAKTDWEIHPNTNHSIKAGLFYSYNTFIPATTSNKISKKGTVPTLATDSIPRRYSNQLAFYVSDEIKFSSAFSANLGVRLPMFLSTGAKYSAIEPRVTLKYSVSPNASLKASYTEMNQFLHLVPSSTASLPTDIWISSSKVIKPELSRQYSLGYFKNFNNNSIETSAELYYKILLFEAAEKT